MVRTSQLLGMGLLVFLMSLLISLPLQAQEKVVYGTSTGGGIRFVTDIIKARNMDKRNGIDLDFKYFAGPKGNAALILGKVDASYFNPYLAAKQTNEGIHFVNFEIQMNSHISVLKPKGSPIRSVDELKGKKFGFIPRSSSTYFTFKIMMAMKGVDADKEFNMIIGNPFALKAFIIRKDVDASIHFEPFSTLMLLNGEAEQVAWFEDMWARATNGKPLLFSTLGARKSWIDAHPKAARGLARTIGEARAWIIANPDEALELGNKALNIKSPRVKAALKKRMLRIYKTPWNQQAIDAGNWQLKKAVELEILKKMPDKPVLAILK